MICSSSSELSSLSGQSSISSAGWLPNQAVFGTTRFSLLNQAYRREPQRHLSFVFQVGRSQ